MLHRRNIDMSRFGWLQNSTWHGLPDLYHSKLRCAKVFWCCVLTCSVMMATTQVTQLTTEYITGSKYSMSETVENIGALKFPNVTICNFNRANSSRQSELGVTDAALEYLFMWFLEPFPVLFSETDAEIYAEKFEQFLSTFNHSFTVRQLFIQLGHQCRSTLIQCWWATVPFDCCDHVNVVLNVFGKCLSIVPPEEFAGNPPKQHLQGWGNALTVMVDPGLHYYSNATFNNFLGEGNVLVINDVPHSFDVANPIPLQPGYTHDVVVNVEQSVYAEPAVPVFPMPCAKNLELKYYPGEYSPLLCYDDCALQIYHKACRCIPEIFPEPKSDKFCTINDVKCGVDLTTSVETLYQWQNCSARCVDRCDYTVSYKTETQKTRLSKAKIVSLSNRYNWTTDPSEIIYVDVHYENMGTVRRTVSEKTTFFDLISNVGGQLSLWCGMSFISFIQIAYYIFRCRKEGVELEKEQPNFPTKMWCSSISITIND